MPSGDNVRKAPLEIEPAKVRGVLGVTRHFVSNYPRRSLTVAASLIGLGVLEGLGVGALLPLISNFTGEGESGNATLHRLTESVLSLFDSEPSVGALLGLVLFTLIAKAIFSGALSIFVGFTRIAIEQDMRDQAMTAIRRSELTYFKGQPHGILINLVSSEITRAVGAFNHLHKLLTATAMTVAYAVLGSTLSLELILMTLGLGGVLVLTMRWPMKMARQAGAQETTYARDLARDLADGLSILKPLKAMSLDGHLGDVLWQHNRNLISSLRLKVLSGQFLRTSQEVCIALFVGGALYASISVLNTPIAEVGFLVVLALRGSQQIAALLKARQQLANSQEALVKYLEVYQSFRSNAETRLGTQSIDGIPSIRFDNLSIAFGDAPILRRVSFDLPPCQFIALTGPSGAGKTTVLDALAGFFIPSEGDILIDGRSLFELDIAGWRRRLGYLTQEPVLLNDSIKQNVAGFEPEVPEPVIRVALERAQAASIVENTEAGLDTNLGHGGQRLSGGERQRIALARALARNPSILLLDEPTAAVDVETERLIVETIGQLKSRMTIIATTHRPALLSIADKVIRMDHGQVVTADTPSPKKPDTADLVAEHSDDRRR